MIAIYTAAALSLAAPATIDPMTADIAGVKLNDTPEAAEKAMLAAGYEIIKRDASESFEQIVEQKVRRRRGEAPQWPKPRAIRQLVAQKATGEGLSVSFMQHPEGSRVSHVEMLISQTRSVPATFLAQVKSKYGEPSRVENVGMSVVYCAQSAGKNCDLPTGLYGLPRLSASTSYSNRLELTVGLNAARDIEKQITAETDRRVPKAATVAF